MHEPNFNKSPIFGFEKEIQGLKKKNSSKWQKIFKLDLELTPNFKDVLNGKRPCKKKLGPIQEKPWLTILMGI